VTHAFDMVVAADDELGIARGGDLPWHLPGDLAHCKRLTTETTDPARHNAVIMGRRTWLSIPPRFRPLPRRVNVVLSRDPDFGPEPPALGAVSLDAALARLDEPDLAALVERVFVVGGGEIYAQAMESAACRDLYITRIEGRFDCDTFFPPFEDRFDLREVMGEGKDGDVAYRIEVWRRRGAA
jgi:dihydrofolate reductase